MPAKKKSTAKKRKTTAKRKTAARKPAKRKTTAKSKTTAKRKTATKRKTTAKRKAPAKRKSTARKSTKKSTTRKTAAGKTSASSIQVLKAAPTIKDPLTKGQLTKTLSEMTGLATKDIKNVLEALEEVIYAHIKSRGPQVFNLAGLAKIKVVRKPATKARKGINPFTGEPTVFKAKPARNVVKVQALKKLKEMAK